MGRKKLKNKLDRIVSIRVNEEMYRILETATAQRKLRSIGELIRDIAENEYYYLTSVKKVAKIKVGSQEGGKS